MDKKLVLIWLMRADLLFDQKLTAPELEELADLWLDALETKDLTREEFEASMRLWMGEERFFPKPAEIADLVFSGRCRRMREEWAAKANPTVIPLPKPAPVMPGISPQMKAVFARRDELVGKGMAPFAALGVAMEERRKREESMARPRETETEIRQ